VPSQRYKLTIAYRGTRYHGWQWQPPDLVPNFEDFGYEVKRSDGKTKVVGDTVFGLTNRSKGQFFALDVKTGATRWTSPPRQGENASITVAGGRLWCLTSDGTLIVLKADPAAYAEVGRLDVVPSATWASPVLLGPQILVKDVDQLRLVRIG